MNRGIARRSVFESRADVRYFLSRLARAVRRRELEVHAYCVMTTHYHLLVRSPLGRLSEGMRRIQNDSSVTSTGLGGATARSSAGASAPSG